MKKMIVALLAFTSVAHASYYCEIYQNDILIDVDASTETYATGVIGPISEDVSMIYHTATTGIRDEEPSLFISNSKTGEKAVRYGSLKDPKRKIELSLQDYTVKCSMEKLKD